MQRHRASVRKQRHNNRYQIRKRQQMNDVQLKFFTILSLQYKCNKQKNNHSKGKIQYNRIATAIIERMIPMSHYRQFTTKEQEKILFFLAQEKTISFIAKELQRDKSSVSREIKRDTNAEVIYSPSYAQRQYEIRRRKCGRKPLISAVDIHQTVQF